MKKDKRFIVVHTENSEFAVQTKIIVDRQTGVNYLYCGSGYGGGLTVMLNRDGTPVITSVIEQE